jgi:DNA mismatch repair protein MutS2
LYKDAFGCQSHGDFDVCSLILTHSCCFNIGGDLSTFSGHMLVCREVLANSGKNALVLMDELGSGTDPAQGVAIAQALLEALVDTGCRVAITTHYMELKQLAAADPRFAVGGMQFVKGRPTYKLLPGTVGESYAMSVAERLGLPQAVIDRATALLDSETRQMGDLIENLQDQLTELEAKKEKMAVLEEQMKEDQVKLERKMLVARRDEAKKFARKLEEKEQVLENILEKLKSDPSRKILAKSWDDIKFVKRDALNEAENVPSVIAARRKAAKTMEDIEAEIVPLAEMREKPNIQPGDKLIMCKPGPLFGREAIVLKNLGRQLEVQVSGMPMAVKLTEVSIFIANVPQAPRKNTNQPGDTKRKLSKAAERALMNESSAPTPRRDATPGGSTKPAGASLTMRTESNTVDVRGLNLSEASDKAKEKFSQCLMTNRSVVFVLHGHGTTGVLKSKVRQWLRSENKLVKRFAPASREDGGDAFTVVELR